MIHVIHGRDERAFKRRKAAVVAVFFALCFSVASCHKNNNNHGNEDIRPSGPKPAWGPTITPQMQTVIEKLASFKAPPLETLTPAEARKQPSAADAAMAVMKDYNIPVPAPGVDTMGKDIPVAGGQIHLRVYTPRTAKAKYPVVVYYHGGGWVIATLDTYHASAQALAEQADAVVVSVAYRQAPEFKYPTAHNDAYAAYLWTLHNASSIKGDSLRVALAGESAGGNLAAGVSLMAKASGVKMPVHQLLIYPIANDDFNTVSYVKYDTAKPLGRPLMKWFFMHYLYNEVQGKDSLISLVDADLRGMPTTTIIAAEIDPLQSEGKMLEARLSAASVEVQHKLYTGVTHEFFGMAPVIPEARQAQAIAAARLKAAFK